MPRVSSKYDVAGIEPAHDPLWHFADERTRREFWREVVRLVKAENEFERGRGRDRYGRKLAPITRYTRAHRKSAMGHADPNAPPLTPADGASRTVAYFDGRAYHDHAEFFWRNGWGTIVGFHAVGARNRWAKSGRLPVRDVRGLSNRSMAKVTKESHRWWEREKGRLTEAKVRPKRARPVPSVRLPAVAAARRVIVPPKPIPVPIPVRFQGPPRPAPAAPRQTPFARAREAFRRTARRVAGFFGFGKE